VAGAGRAAPRSASATAVAAATRTTAHVGTLRTVALVGSARRSGPRSEAEGSADTKIEGY
jgi:hypothetical protein